MNELRQAAQQALEALGSSLYPQPRQMAALAALRAALAQQAKPVEPVEPVEPYCYVYEYDGVFGLHREFYPLPYNGMKPSRTVPVYTAPPQRKPERPAPCPDCHGIGYDASGQLCACQENPSFG